MLRSCFSISILALTLLVNLSLKANSEPNYADYETGEEVTNTESMCMLLSEYGYEGDRIVLGEFDHQSQTFDTRYIVSSEYSVYLDDTNLYMQERHGYNMMSYAQVINGYLHMRVIDDGWIYVYVQNTDGSFSDYAYSEGQGDPGVG